MSNLTPEARELLQLYCSKPEVDTLQACILNALAYIAELEAKLVNAREALGKYGCHKPNCIWIRGTIEKPRACDCGLEEALAALNVDAIPTNTEVIKEAKRNAFGNVTSALEVEK